MLETLREWLNGNREYFLGVGLYAQAGNNIDLLNLFKKGTTPFTTRRLQEELLAICNHLKEKQNVPTQNTPGPHIKQQGNTDEAIGGRNKPEIEIHPHTQAIYNAAKLEADKQYKLVMNMRAELFALAKVDDFVDPNKPDSVLARTKLALAVVQEYQKVGELYDRANYVKINGRLPDQEADAENEYDLLPDYLVFNKLDLLRKYYNKTKKREPSAENIALLQEQEKNIKKLEARWHLLQPK